MGPRTLSIVRITEALPRKGTPNLRSRAAGLRVLLRGSGGLVKSDFIDLQVSEPQFSGYL